jgi:N-acyl-phosphatidylethanolamine-hydrolysing phospholipase D
MRRAFGLLLSAALVLLTAVGCEHTGRIARFTALNFAVLFDEPRPVEHRVSDPHVPGARLSALWVGHATVLLQLDDRWVLTDPVFTRRVGQLSNRLVEPGLRPDQLPELDVVLISHLHFDHLSLGSLDLIEDRIRTLVLPEGGAVYVPHSRVLPVELPQGVSFEQDGLRVTAVPAAHNGMRYGLDREWLTTSYTGYVIEYRGTRVYFAGDTAFRAEDFRDIGGRFGELDLALLPIAPIEPRDFMHRHHTDPDEALTAFQLLRAKWLLPIHFDTFVNSFDEFGAAPRALREAMGRRGIGPDRVTLLRHGEQRVYAWRR